MNSTNWTDDVALKLPKMARTLSIGVTLIQFGPSSMLTIKSASIRIVAPVSAAIIVVTSEVLIKAFKAVSEKIPATRLVIAGSGEEEGVLKHLAKKLGMQENVEFMGPVSEQGKIELFQKSWVFVNPSMMEGWGITTIEANACATPVVASDVPGLRDSVRNPHTGYLVKHGEAELFAEQIIELLRSEKLRMRIGENGLRWARNFDWNITSKKFLQVIENDEEFFLEKVYGEQKDQV